jgi:hypothetical protein
VTAVRDVCFGRFYRTIAEATLLIGGSTGRSGSHIVKFSPSCGKRMVLHGGFQITPFCDAGVRVAIAFDKHSDSRRVTVSRDHRGRFNAQPTDQLVWGLATFEPATVGKIVNCGNLHKRH